MLHLSLLLFLVNKTKVKRNFFLQKLKRKLKVNNKSERTKITLRRAAYMLAIQRLSDSEVRTTGVTRWRLRQPDCMR